MKICMKYKNIQTKYLSMGLIYLVITVFTNLKFPSLSATELGVVMLVRPPHEHSRIAVIIIRTNFFIILYRLV